MATKEYVRLTFRTGDGRRTVWAVVKSRDIKISGKSLILYLEVTKDGNELHDACGGVVQRRLILTTQEEIISEYPAKMNLMYAELEVVK